MNNIRVTGTQKDTIREAVEHMLEVTIDALKQPINAAEQESLESDLMAYKDVLTAIHDSDLPTNLTGLMAFVDEYIGAALDGEDADTLTCEVDIHSRIDDMMMYFQNRGD